MIVLWVVVLVSVAQVCNCSGFFRGSLLSPIFQGISKRAIFRSFLTGRRPLLGGVSP